MKFDGNSRSSTQCSKNCSRYRTKENTQALALKGLLKLTIQGENAPINCLTELDVSC